MTSYQCSACPRVTIEICETTREENIECQRTDDCTCDSINDCKYCDYFLCDECYYKEEHQEVLHFANYKNAQNVCFECLKTKPICVSCHQIFPSDSSNQLEQGDSVKLEKCEVCHWKVCSSCVSLVDNLHFTSKKPLCLDCNHDWNHRPMVSHFGEWYITQYVWYHDGCLKMTYCQECGNCWCLDHDLNKLYRCNDPTCPDGFYGPTYCAKCVGKHYENDGYCSFCVAINSVMKISII